MRFMISVAVLAVLAKPDIAFAQGQNYAQECARYTCASTARSLDQCITCNMSVGPWTREQSVQWCNRWMARCKAPGAK